MMPLAEKYNLKNFKPGQSFTAKCNEPAAKRRSRQNEYYYLKMTSWIGTYDDGTVLSAHDDDEKCWRCEKKE